MSRNIAPGAQNVILTGFRAGEVRDIMLWLEPVLPTAGAAGGVGQIGEFIWSQLTNLTLTYNGEIFFTSNGGAAQMWNLIEDKKSAQVSLIDVNPATGAAAGDVPSYWTLVKFSQVDVPRDRMYDLVSGKPILNAVVNLQFTAPALPTIGGATATSFNLHAVYLYNASLLCSRGTTDYVF